VRAYQRCLFSHNTPYNPQRRNNKNRTRKKTSKNQQKGAKWNEQSVKQVLCVNTELGANAGGEVRGDLKDSAVVA
jgi:hypothetical protein